LLFSIQGIAATGGALIFQNLSPRHKLQIR
jgi:hypothetical protein